MNTDFLKLEGSPTSSLINELRNKLREAYREIEIKNEALDKKDHDLIMAAELGACLIDDNENLKKLCLKYTKNDVIEQVLVVPSKTSYSSKRLHDDTEHDNSEIGSIQRYKEELEVQTRQLERKINALQEALSSRDAEIKKLSEFKRISGRQISNADEEKDILISKLGEVNDNMRIIEENNLELSTENTKLHETISILQKKLESSRNTSEILEQYNSLKEQNSNLLVNKSIIEKEKIDLARAFEESKQTLSTSNIEIEELRGEIERMTERQRSLEWELASERELISKLQLKLTSTEMSHDDAIHSSIESHKGIIQNSLFSEVDDRRKELENKNNEIMKTHMAYVRRQEIMKDYIKRLLSLANLKNSDPRIKRLEDALSQAESEKKELSTRLHISERRLAMTNRRSESKIRSVNNADYNSQTSGEVPNESKDDVLGLYNTRHDSVTNTSSLGCVERECLIATVNTLKEECVELGKEVKTLRILNANELEKLRNVELLLRDREDELVRVKASALQIKLEYDTLKSKVYDEYRRSPGLLLNSKHTKSANTFDPLFPKNKSGNSSESQAKCLDTGDMMSVFFQLDNSIHDKLDNSVLRMSDGSYDTNTAKHLLLEDNKTYTED